MIPVRNHNFICEFFLLEFTIFIISATQFDGLRDNRDFFVLSYYGTPPRTPLSEHVEVSRAQEVLWIRYRCLSLRILGITFEQIKPDKRDHLVNGNSDQVQDGSYEDLEGVISQLENVFEVAEGLKSKEEQFLTKYTVHGPPKSRWIKWCEGNFSLPVITTAKLVFQMIIPSDTQFSETEIEKSLEILNAWFNESFQRYSSTLTSDVWGKDMINGSNFEHVSLLIEMVNFVAMVIALLMEIGRRRFKRSKKKKASSSEKQGVFQMLDDLTQKIVIHLKDLHKNLDDLENGNIAKGLDETTLDELFEKTQSDLVLEIWKNIQASYKQSILEVSQIIELKIKFLNSLKC